MAPYYTYEAVFDGWVINSNYFVFELLSTATVVATVVSIDLAIESTQTESHFDTVCSEAGLFGLQAAKNATNASAKIDFFIWYKYNKK